MRGLFLMGLMFLAAVAQAQPATTQPATQPATQPVLRRFSSEDEAIRSIQFEFQFKAQAGRLIGRVAYVAPDRYAMWIGDEDQTPLLLAINGDVLVYDVLGERMMVAE